MDQAGAGQLACVDVQVAQMINQRRAFVAQWIVFGSGDQSRRQSGRRAHEAPRAVVLDSIETAGPRIPAGCQYAVRAPTTIAGRHAIAAHAPVRGPALRCPAVVFGVWPTNSCSDGSARASFTSIFSDARHYIGNRPDRWASWLASLLESLQDGRRGNRTGRIVGDGEVSRQSLQ
jgi:hypothetical protein